MKMAKVLDLYVRMKQTASQTASQTAIATATKTIQQVKKLKWKKFGT